MNAEETKVGCFQVAIVLLLGVNYIIVAMSHALPAFHYYTPQFYCKTKDGALSASSGCEAPIADVASNFTGEGTSKLMFCSTEDYHFVVEPGVNTVVTEWMLICEKRYLALLGPSVYYAGALIGAWIAGILADRIGRLPIQAICLYTQGTMAVALYVVPNYPTFLALRGLQGVFVQGLQNSTYILSLELFPARARTIVALIMQIAWAIGLVLLAVLSYVVPDWRILQLAISVPTAITVLYVWIIPESPRWLLAKGKSTEADMTLERITKYNACCGTKYEESIPKPETIASENTMPMKPERRSRVTNVDVAKTKSDDATQEESTNLLISTDFVPQKVRKTSLQVISENLQKTLSNGEQENENLSKEDGPAVERRSVPSCSKKERRSKSMSQPASNQRMSMKNMEEIVEFRSVARKEKNGESKAKDANEVEESSDVPISRDWKQLFRTPLLRKYRAVMICSWFTSAITFYLIEYHTPNFNINRHVTFALGGALELASYVFIYIVLSRYGRRFPMSFYQIINGVICFVVVGLTVLPTYPIWNDIGKIIILLFGRVTVISTIFVAYLYTVEIFPTVLRGTSLGLCVVSAKIGSIIAPHTIFLAERISIAVPLSVVGVLCLICGALTLHLPETINTVLPDNALDMEQLIQNTKRKQNLNNLNNDNTSAKEDLTQHEILREKLFSEEWVDAGNGILVNFSENKNAD